MKKYYPFPVELDAQQYWKTQKSFKAFEMLDKEKFYSLCMFPYPSGKLHLGHLRNYTIGDVITRFKRLLGKNVLQPIGWDALGMPAENAARKISVKPCEWTNKNIDHMRNQLKALGLAYDWDREYATCDVDYYRWEQWLFVKVFSTGLFYRKTEIVNFDPIEHTVLANEQVTNGRGWRSGAQVVPRQIPLWFLRIKAYADELLSDITYLFWPENVKTMQRNWIGKSKGVELDFLVLANDLGNELSTLTVFTTRPDTLMGVTYLAVAVDHPIANFHLSFLKAVHPITNNPLPIFITNMIESGAVMGVPAHDQRYFEFANKYDLPIIPVIAATGKLINSFEYNDLIFHSAFDAIALRIESSKRGRVRINFRLRDWCIARQRYWGVPIPVKYGPFGEILPLAEEELPIGIGIGIGIGSWLRETDTFDTFIESSWYYARFCCANIDTILDNRANYWLPVDIYIGGVEHAILHLMYARFFHKLMRDLGLVDSNEPFKRLLTQGMVLAKTYSRELADGSYEWYNPVDVDVHSSTAKRDGQPVKRSGIEKMSKSKNNGVDPKSQIDLFGADAVRLFMMFTAPIEQSLEWSNIGVDSAHRFLQKLWKITINHLANCKQTFISCSYLKQKQRDFRQNTHYLISKVGDSLENSMTFNTAIAALMELANDISSLNSNTPQYLAVALEAVEAIVVLLSPFVPHITNALWHLLGHDSADAYWPIVDKTALNDDYLTLAVQINGKVRAQILLNKNDDYKSIKRKALYNLHLKFKGNLFLFKVIFVLGKIVNIIRMY